MKRLQNIIFIFFLLFFAQSELFALHIIGGDFSYECLGGDKYRFTLKIYRDCNSGGAPLDPTAAITIFGFSSTGPFLDQNFGTNNISTTDIVPVLDNPCLEVPSGLCVEQGLYIFERELDYLEGGYVIAYQRCCRNPTINNIQNPSNVGATYTVTLTKEAQTECNSSPIFNNFPPIVICANEPLNFDHSATDPNGDSLVYSFCEPTIGGSPSEPAPPSASTPFALYPHYAAVDFVGPQYTVQAPMAGTPVVSIDSNTGVITGTPVTQGQFVVGVCIEEYRNGQFLSISRRDFQFNVTDCDRKITADIREDEIIGPKEYVVNSCGNTEITFINESGLLSNIEGYLWEFEIGSGLPNVTSDATNPVITFPGVGTYEGTLIVNPDNAQCSDTALIYVNVFPDINADYSFVFDSCEISPISYTDLSTTGAGQFESWFWDFRDGTTSDVQNPVHQFSDAGTYNVVLTVRDTNDCVSTITKEIEWYPESDILVELEKDEGCVPFTPSIVNNSFPLTGYTTTWDMGDGMISNEASPVYEYTEPGVYSLDLTITSPIGCIAQQSFPDLITVYPVPIADFSFLPEAPTNFDPVVDFTDLSSGAASWLWNFGTGDNSSQSNPTYVFSDTGMFAVMLTVTHPQGCKDSIIKIVDVEPRFTYFLPNAFTPNFDDLNDGFRGAGIFYGIEEFEMTIWNRWGEQIFTTNDPNISWNGRKNNTGKLEQSDVYVYRVKIRGARNQKFEYKGFATLVR